MSSQNLSHFLGVHVAVFCILGCLLTSCGKAYFPIELKTKNRNERLKGQVKESVELVPMNNKSIAKANLTPYKQRVIEAGDLSQPAKIILAEEALEEKYPTQNDPGPYKIGVGDELSFSKILDEGNSSPTFSTRSLVVPDDGLVNIFEIGKIRAEGLTQSKLEDSIYRSLLEKGLTGNFELSITKFRSKKIFVVADNVAPKTLPYTNSPIFLEDLLSQVGLKIIPGVDAKVTISRQGEEFVFSLVKLLKKPNSQFRIYPEDKVFVRVLNYRKEAVLVVGETGAQKALEISSYLRPTLSDTIFGGQVLNNVTSDFSQIYVIREIAGQFFAYHLDITNPVRIKLANKFEMRPDDIVFVAAQPLTLYNRTLQQILGSYGITSSARDAVRSELKLNSN